MELIQYLLIIILCLSAISTGMLIGHLARPEIAPGVKWFRWLQRILLISMVVIAGLNSLFAQWILALIVIMVVLMLLPRTSIFLTQLAPGPSFLFPLLLFASRQTELIGTFATLIITFHVAQGTLWIGRRDKRIRFAAVHAATFFTLSLALWFL